MVSEAYQQHVRLFQRDYNAQNRSPANSPTKAALRLNGQATPPAAAAAEEGVLLSELLEPEPPAAAAAKPPLLLLPELLGPEPESLEVDGPEPLEAGAGGGGGPR